MSPSRPQDPSQFQTWANDVSTRLRAIERRILRKDEIDVLQTFEDGDPLGDTLFLGFGTGLSAVLTGDRFVEVTSTAGGGKEYATWVIAASDTHQSGKDVADAVCDGVADQVEINTALDNNARRVVLLEGTFNLSAAITPGFPNSNGNDVFLQGMGRGATVLNCTGNGFDFTQDVGLETRDFTIAHLTIDGPGATNTGVLLSAISTENPLRTLIWDCEIIQFSIGVQGGSNTWVIGCFITTTTGIRSLSGNQEELVVDGCLIEGTTSIDARGTRSRIVRNLIKGTTTGLILTAAGADLKDADNSVIVANIFSGNTVPMDIRAPMCSITGNTVMNAGAVTLASQAFGTILTSNTIQTPKSGTYGIDVAASECCIAKNVVRDVAGGLIAFLSGIRSTGSRNVVQGNIVSLAQQHGILLDGADNCTVVANQIVSCSQQTSNTYDGIHLVNGADANNIQGNTVRGSGTHRYGINVSSASEDDNLVTNNDLLNSAVTGSLNDAGTGTITAAGNRL